MARLSSTFFFQKEALKNKIVKQLKNECAKFNSFHTKIYKVNFKDCQSNDISNGFDSRG